MRTSLNEIQHIENHLFGQLSGEEELLFQANLLINTTLEENKQAQQKSYQLINAFGRKQLKQELEGVHLKLFSEKRYKHFRQKILALFNI
ncbi:hypothetical protein [Rubrolithibacter danxiaensis]|uniref:hypothetical protein n=1 Tax=Rubrolithibacter danxiaensis TaxID=3390805 RepID=UPI003BF8CC86